MPFQPQQYLGRDLPNLMAALAEVDPNQLPTPDQGLLQPHHALTMEAETLEVAKLRPQAFLPTVVDSRITPEHPDIHVPDVVLESFLGGGSQGWVYAGQVRSTGKIVAVKVIRSDFEATRLAVAREARICSRIRHYNVLRVFEVQSTGAFWVVLMELVQGEQLGKTGMSLIEFRRCFAALADAVATLGDRGIVHRDIKPANVLRRRDDSSPVLVDFGLAVDLEALEPGDTAGICGTPLFMAPEAFERGVRPTPAWDVYALGITALNVLLGKINSPTTLDTLWESKRSGQFQSMLGQSLDRVEDPELREWVRLLTESDPARRAAGLMMAREWVGEKK